MIELFIGAGKGFALDLVRTHRNLGHRVICVSGSPSDNTDDIQVNWDTLNSSDIFKICKRLPNIDFLFFNQKSSALSEKSFCPDTYQVLELWKQSQYWNRCYFMSCILPFEFIHGLGSKLSDSSRVSWMLSSMIIHHKNNFQNADYIGQKFQNYLLMKNFAKNHPSCFFGINPGDISIENFKEKLDNFEKIFSKSRNELNGKVWNIDSVAIDDVTEILG